VLFNSESKSFLGLLEFEQEPWINYIIL
jgi:hypothetical protein